MRGELEAHTRHNGTMTNADQHGAQLPKLVLHVGMPKTGSSVIQSSLALSRNHLAAAGIHYPQHWSDDAAVAGFVTSGNIDIDEGTSLRDIFLREMAHVPPTIHTVLFSNEIMSRALLANPQILRDVRDVADVLVLSFVRNPVEWLASTYGQFVKGKGLTDDLDAFIPQWTYPTHAVKFFTLCDELGVGLTVRNYSTVRKTLLDVFANMLSPETAVSLIRPEREIVNRSLTPSEEALQRALNRTDFRHPEALADALVNQLPDVQVLPRRVAARSVDILEKCWSDAFDQLAQFLPEGEAPSFDQINASSTQLDAGDDESRYSFSQAQLDVVMQTLVSTSHIVEREHWSSIVNDLRAELSMARSKSSSQFTRFFRRTNEPT